MNSKKKKELEDKWKALVVKAVTDEDYKRELVDQPVEKMNAEGIPLPEGVDVKVTGKGPDKRFSLVAQTKASDEVKEEIKWWTLRLEMTREFGQEHRKVGIDAAAPGEGEDV
ncbi:MAG: hypothetical protein G3M78_10530 [Candidatus Nitrohelix vancouverensis]|uniref:Uncharacterized protein n=1 Tax=Candidatus Nitrohelix vancouverensis TaxID=2705534 RepID=A0A7T0C3D5_9BACT|nr:MAG: hypothetical protein G3M78_10530 [Candidatus Nitrohelix vancouverensis]